jgi:hypothetical protein
MSPTRLGTSLLMSPQQHTACMHSCAHTHAHIPQQALPHRLAVAGGVDCDPRRTCGECGQPVLPAAAAAAAAATAAAGGAMGNGSSGGSNGSNGSSAQLAATRFWPSLLHDCSARDAATIACVTTHTQPAHAHVRTHIHHTHAQRQATFFFFSAGKGIRLAAMDSAISSGNTR